MKKIGKALLAIGILAFALGTLGIAGGIIFSFSSLHTNESAGIGAVGAGIQFALIGSIIGIGGVLMSVVGIILLLVSKRPEFD